MDSVAKTRSLVSEILHKLTADQQQYGNLNGNATPLPVKSGSLPPRPWSREDLFARLLTFRASTWFAKPSQASALQCALHGWMNTGLDMVTCSYCSAKLCCVVPPTCTAAQTATLGDKFANRLRSDGHAVHCPWRTLACDPSLAEFEGGLESEQRRKLDARQQSVTALCQRLGRRPRVDLASVHSLGLPTVTQEDEAGVMRVLAACGWEAHEASNSLTCTCCQTRFLLPGKAPAADSAPLTQSAPTSTPAVTATPPQPQAQQQAALPLVTPVRPPRSPFGAPGFGFGGGFGFSTPTAGDNAPPASGPFGQPQSAVPAFGSPAPAFGSHATPTAPTPAPQPAALSAPTLAPASVATPPSASGWAFSLFTRSIAGGASPSLAAKATPLQPQHTPLAVTPTAPTQQQLPSTAPPANTGSKRPREDDVVPAASKKTLATPTAVPVEGSGNGFDPVSSHKAWCVWATSGCKKTLSLLK